ncbi:hypothetical protein QVD17_35369 [Tagetes erecta]|uniref:Uncharacterized protein n=1 Tax=Tagetes erecta TaxID=13708 RepID=A0AAD8K0Q8_TARER|nr:hypothetical protein QVD17_35369 [Tagetes erecta]
MHTTIITYLHTFIHNNFWLFPILKYNPFTNHKQNPLTCLHTSTHPPNQHIFFISVIAHFRRFISVNSRRRVSLNSRREQQLSVHLKVVNF